MFNKIQSSLGALWCSLAHDSVMWPVHGHYECRACGRQYPAFGEAPVTEPNRSGSPRAESAVLSRA